MFDEGAEQFFVMLQGSRMSSCRGGEGIEFKQEQIGKRIHLEIGVEILDGIELGRIGWE